MAEKDTRRLRFASLAAAMCLAGALAPHAAASPVPDGPAAPLVASEGEPNDTPASANVLGFSGPLAIVRGAIGSAGDFDYYVFRAPAGYKVWVLVDTGGVQAASGTGRDSLLTLLGSDGTTTIEFDNDNGTGTGGDASVETFTSSAIAGRTLTAAGAYYLQVRAFSTTVIDPYRLYVLLTPGTYPAETEPNDTPGLAEPLLLSSNSFGAQTAVATQFDLDYFAVKARAGDVLFVGTDADPERDGPTALSASVIAPDGTTFLSGNGTVLGGDAVSLAYVIPSSGTYYVRVSSPGFGSNQTYDIAVALSGAVQGSVTAIRSAIGSDSPDHPSFHGSLSDRPFRDLGGSICGLPGPCSPPVAGGPFLYDAYPFFNGTDNVACISVDLDAMTCAASGGLFAVAYLNSFDPENLCSGYAGDLGFLPDPRGLFSFEVPPHTAFVIVVSEAAPATLCPAYTLRVSGLCDGVGLVVDEDAGMGTASNLNGVLEAGETVRVEPTWIHRDFYEAFEAMTPPQLPIDWGATLLQGEPGDATWKTVSTSAHSPPNSAFVPAPGHVTDNRLRTPLFIAAATSTLVVRHAFDFEDSHDGGVIEISINGGAFVDIIAAGGTFFFGQEYNRTIMAATGSPLAGRDAFSGSSNGYVSSLITLPPSAIGEQVWIGFRAASDSAGASAGWNVDSILMKIDGSQLFGGAALTGPAGPVYETPGPAAYYGNPALPSDISACNEFPTGCYRVSVSGNRPATHWDAVLREQLTTGQYRRWPVHVGGSFGDVPAGNLFYRFVETILHNGVTAGGACGGYCPNASVLRKQMAVFVLKARAGAAYIPAPANGDFVDVPPTDPFAPWIEDLHHRGVVAGCGPGPAYCPDAPVLRQQMPVFLLKTLLGASYSPPACSALFGDVPCLNPFAPWIEEVYRRGIAAGCSLGLYCPTNATTRGQMSPFLVKTFGLVLYGP